KLINSFKNFYLKQLGVSGKGNLAFIQTTPTGRRSFTFVAHPSIINVGIGKYSLLGLYTSRKQTIAHELAHSYFGDYLNRNSAFAPVIDEGFAEYLSFKAIKTLISDSIFQTMVDQKIRSLKFFKAKPFDHIKTIDVFADQGYRELYVYYYTPIILTAIEKEIGEQNMWKWMKTMMATKTEFTDYTFLENTLKITLNNSDKLELVKSKYLSSSQSLENAMEALRR